MQRAWRDYANQSPDQACVAWGQALHDTTLIVATGPKGTPGTAPGYRPSVPANLVDDLTGPAMSPARGPAPLLAAEEVLEQAAFAEALGLGPEVVHGFRIYGNKGLVGTSYQRNILLIEAEQVGATSPRALLRAFEAEARAAGASELRIVGHAVVNEKLVNPGLAQRLGYAFRQVDDSTIELVKALEQ